MRKDTRPYFSLRFTAPAASVCPRSSQKVEWHNDLVPWVTAKWVLGERSRLRISDFNAARITPDMDGVGWKDCDKKLLVRGIINGAGLPGVDADDGDLP